MPATTVITTACINCHTEAPKLAKGLCKPCYDYQRRHGGARPVVVSIDEQPPVEPPPVDPAPPVVDQLPQGDQVPQVDPNDPHTAALAAIMELAAEGKNALLQALHNGALRWKTAKPTGSKTGKGGEPRGKMTDDQVRALRADRVAGMSYGAIAAKYGMSPMGARAVAMRETYKHVQ